MPSMHIELSDQQAAKLRQFAQDQAYPDSETLLQSIVSELIEEQSFHHLVASRARKALEDQAAGELLDADEMFERLHVELNQHYGAQTNP